MFAANDHWTCPRHERKPKICCQVQRSQKPIFEFIIEKVANTHLYTYLKEHSISQAITLIIPVIWNIIVCVHNTHKVCDIEYDEDKWIEHVLHTPFALADASEEIRGNRKIVLAAVQRSSWNLQWACKELLNDPYFMLAAIQKNATAFEWASEELRGDEEVVFPRFNRTAQHLSGQAKNFVAIEKSS
ncbi:MAG TPA: DUF4116 domain-containing protein [Chlamydiales bacterium]|nr:DUF4116 domain-containing protein [Chlamydiales bacterium]